MPLQSCRFLKTAEFSGFFIDQKLSSETFNKLSGESFLNSRETLGVKTLVREFFNFQSRVSTYGKSNSRRVKLVLNFSVESLRNFSSESFWSTKNTQNSAVFKNLQLWRGRTPTKKKNYMSDKVPLDSSLNLVSDDMRFVEFH